MMPSQFKSFVGLLILTLLWVSSAKASDLAERLSKIQSASGSFEQTILEQDGYVVDRQTGIFAMQRPRQLRWKISELDQLLISDGKQLYLYDELFQQVVVRDWSSNPAVNPAAILLEQNDISEWANIEVSGDNYRLTPLDNFGSIVELNMLMDGSFPELLTILDATGQTTEIRFFQLELDILHDEGLFHFEIPEGVEVVYE